MTLIYTNKFYKIQGKIYMALVVNKYFPTRRFQLCAGFCSQRVFPNLRNMQVEEVTEKEADEAFYKNSVR
jgi:hypothetical protein